MSDYWTLRLVGVPAGMPRWSVRVTLGTTGTWRVDGGPGEPDGSRGELMKRTWRDTPSGQSWTGQ